jgi:uncharacterized protein (DUF488 family)
MRLYTIGHSTRTRDELVTILKSFGVQTLVDIRTVPRSRHVPQFNREALSRSLPRRGIRYKHLKALGGLRKPRADSPNAAWRNASFRGFADYMQTPEFADALDEARSLAREAGPAALMCAEAVPWRCHRNLVADALTARGDTVVHIMGADKGHAHVLTPWAVVEGTRVSYPGPPPEPKPRQPRPTVTPRSRAVQGTLRLVRTAGSSPALRSGAGPGGSRRGRSHGPQRQ